MHPVHSCHHIKACHPPVKQYIMTHHNIEFIIYTCSLFFICNTKGRVVEWFVNNIIVQASVQYMILYTGLCPPRGTSLEVFFPPLLPFPLLPPFLCQTISRSLLPSHLSIALSMPLSVPSLTHPPSTHPSSTDALSLLSIIASSLPPLDPFLPLQPPLAPSLQPSTLPCSFPALSLSVGIDGDSQSLLEREPLRRKDRGLLSYNIDTIQ